MSKSKASSPVPKRIRDSCAEAFESTIGAIAKVASGTGGSAVQISAFDKLGKYGLGGRNELLFEGRDVLEVCLRAVRETLSPSDAAFGRFRKRLIEELEAARDLATEGELDGAAADVEPDD